MRGMNPTHSMRTEVMLGCLKFANPAIEKKLILQGAAVKRLPSLGTRQQLIQCAQKLIRSISLKPSKSVMSRLSRPSLTDPILKQLA